MRELDELIDLLEANRTVLEALHTQLYVAHAARVEP